MLTASTYGWTIQLSIIFTRKFKMEYVWKCGFDFLFDFYSGAGILN